MCFSFQRMIVWESGHDAGPGPRDLPRPRERLSSERQASVLRGFGDGFSSRPQDGRHVAHTVPEGAVIRVDSAAFDGDRLVDVTSDGKKVIHPLNCSVPILTQYPQFTQ
jgi:hypothetical protein